jgi:hypothetical protein
MNTNRTARIANNNGIANVTRIANNDTVVNTTQNAKEHNIMNACKNFVTRAAKTLGAIALLALAQAAVKAEVVVDIHPDGAPFFTGPQASYNQPSTGNAVAPGTTAMQIKVHNLDQSVGASGVRVQTYIYFATDVNNGWIVRAMPSTTVNLAPGEDRWVTIDIPNESLQGKPLRGHYLYAKAIVDSHTYWLNDFLDAACNIGIQVYAEKYNSDGTISLTVEFTNNGYINSVAQSVTLSYMPYADGNLWTKPGTPPSETLPALVPNQAFRLTFKTASLSDVSYSYINGTVQIGTDETLSLRF